MSITNYGAQGAGVLDRQVFAAAGTWTKPTGAQLIRVQVLAGGGGGGSGRCGATGASIDGGQGGAAGMYAEQWYAAGVLPATVAVTVGTGGAGGASVNTALTDGLPGATGAASSFGSLLVTIPQIKAAPGGLNVQAGSDGGISAYGLPANPTGQASAIIWGHGGASNSQINGVPGTLSLLADPARNHGHAYQPVGGAGGGWRQSNAQATGGQGYQNLCMNDDNKQAPQPPGGTGAGVNPVAVVKTLTDMLHGCIPYYGGAGGQCCPMGITGGTGGAGGDAQGYGAGGGGGGPSTGTSPSGTGGRGAPGLVIVTCYP